MNSHSVAASAGRSHVGELGNERVEPAPRALGLRVLGRQGMVGPALGACRLPRGGQGHGTGRSPTPDGHQGPSSLSPLWAGKWAYKKGGRQLRLEHLTVLYAGFGLDFLPSTRGLPRSDRCPPSCPSVLPEARPQGEGMRPVLAMAASCHWGIVQK